MSKKCPKCEGKDIHITYYPAPTDNMATCYGCGYADLAERFPEQTVFDCITSSEEVLAPRLVFCAEYKTIRPMYLEGKGGIIVGEVWKSTVIPGASFKSESEAVAATIEKLKEVEK